MPYCKHCHRRPRKYGMRGLCQVCYRTPFVRDRYPAGGMTGKWQDPPYIYPGRNQETRLWACMYCDAQVNRDPMKVCAECQDEMERIKAEPEYQRCSSED
jgi:hypothetical protein